MNKLEQLFVRACKSKTPGVRLLSLYKRFYIYHESPECYGYIAHVLIKICDKYELVSLVQLMDELNPVNAWKFNIDNISYDELCMKVLANKIRFSEASKFPELTPPAMFRNK